MKNQTNSAWTPELRERVKKLWLTNSASEIVSALHAGGYTFSRSAIIGFVSRAGLTGKHKTEVHPFTSNKSSGATVSARHTQAIFRPRVNPEEAKLRCVEIAPRNITLIDLEPGDCRYPYGDGPMTFCGHPKQDGSQYCTPHHHLCWVKPITPAPKARVYHGTDFARGVA
jgi:GcrA cell cycle regulator